MMRRLLAPPRAFLTTAVPFLRSQWFLLALTTALVTGWFGAYWLEPIANAVWLRYGVVATVLFLMALPVSPAGIAGGVQRPISGLLAIGLNVVAVPLAAMAGRAILPPAAAAGLIVAAIVPCTLASATVWTRRAGGDTSIAILTTIVTNAACFLVAPLWLSMLLGKTVPIDSREQVTKLFLLVVLPMTVAQIARVNRDVSAFALRHKSALSTIAQVGILTMVMIGVVQMRIRLGVSSERDLTMALLVRVCLATAGLHTLILAAGWYAARALRRSRADQIAIAIAGSQKTLMVGLQIAIDAGVSILPMIAYHIGQLFIDTLFADRVKRASSNSQSVTTRQALPKSGSRA